MPIKVLVLGASGLLGNTLVRYFDSCPGIEATGTVRSESSREAIQFVL